MAQVSALQKQRPNTAGAVQLNAHVTAELSGELRLTTINGNAAVRGLHLGGQNYGDLTATATTSGQAVNYNLTSNFAGSNIHIDGNTQLARDYPTTARANFGNLPVQRLLAVADRNDIPLKGMLSGSASFMGTIDKPQGSADLTLLNASLYDNAVDRIHLTAQYDQAPGNLQFHLDPTTIDLTRMKTLAEKLPGLTGTVHLNAAGTAQIRSSEPRVLVRDLSGNLTTSGLAMNGKSLGDLTLAANTAGGKTNFTLTSGMAGASIEGRGSVQLATDYPADAQVTFKNVNWARLGPLLGYNAGEGRGFEAAADGQVSLDGPLLNTQQLHASIQVTRLEVSGAASSFRKTNRLVLQNQGPIAGRWTMEHSKSKALT